MNIIDLIKKFLLEYQSENSELEIQLIIAHVMNRSRAWILTHLDTPLSQSQIDCATQAFSKLQAGTPLPYILGRWEFFGLDFEVNENVLIPRPETELLVERAISFLTSNPEKRNAIDVGTGSGIIAISIAKHISDAKILATDISPKAIEVAKRNAIKHNVENQIEFIECDLLPVNDRPQIIDFICANLPYIPTKTLHELEVYGKEPTLALDGGEDGLGIYRKLFLLAKQYGIKPSVWLCEFEERQGKPMTNLVHEIFDDAIVNVHQDLTGKDRLVEIVM